MALLPITERADEIIKLDLLGRLKKLNFRKRKNGFWRETQSTGPIPTKIVQAIDVKVGGTMTNVEGVISAAVGVFYTDFLSILTPWQKVAPSPVTAQDGHVKAPIGLLGAWKNADHSWRVDATTDDNVLAKELADAVETLGLPYLDAASDLGKIANGEVVGADPYLVVLALQKLGKKDVAKAKIDEILASNPGRYMEVASFAGRLKLPVPPRPAKA
jgi:hypothetical protein